MLALRTVLRDEAERVLVGSPADWVIRATDPRTLSTPVGSAYVKIGEGCNRTCSFCVIPSMRGAQRSRAPQDVVDEVSRLVAQGVREVNVIAQDTIAYGRDLRRASDVDITLPGLLRAVADVPGVHWVRIFYLYPEVLSPALVELIAHHPRVVPYVDMPLQHASDAMLLRMRRGHGGDRLRRLVVDLKKSIPDLTFRSAFIVGHPGETEAEFQELCDFVRWAELDHVGVFRYSDEEGCGSVDLPGKVPAKVADARYRTLMRLQRGIAREKNRRLIGRELEVLVVGTSDEHEHVLMGRHAGQAPDIDGHVYLSGGEAQPGEFRQVVVSQASDYDLVGELFDEEERGDDPLDARPRGRVSLRVLPTDGRASP